MISSEVEKIVNYLKTGFREPYRITDICKSFEILSKDDNNKRVLVNNQQKAINFDILSKWLCKISGIDKKGNSADALTFAGKRVVLIEFKTGDQEKNADKRKDLLNNVKDKINDSSNTIRTLIFDKIPDINPKEIELDFYLVIDAEAMGMINAMSEALTTLSAGSSYMRDERVQKMLEDLLGKFTEEDLYFATYNKVDIWYSNMFDFYLEQERIEDIYTYI